MSPATHPSISDTVKDMWSTNKGDVIGLPALAFCCDDATTRPDNGSRLHQECIDPANMTIIAQSLAMENIMYTRTFLAANPDVISADGSINLGNAGSNPLMIPMDLAQAVSNNAASSSSSASASAASSTASATGSASSAAASSTQSTTGAAKSGAGQLASPRAAVGLVGLAAMLFML